MAGGLDSAARLRAEEAGADYEVALESLNQWQLAARKFRRHRLALVGLGHPRHAGRGGDRGPDLLPFDFYSIPEPDEIVYQGRPPVPRALVRRDRRAPA